MTFTLNNIPEALAIQSGIEKTQNSLQDTLYRLATGVNLNKSAVVDSVNSYDVPIHSEAIRNVSDAISLNSTAIDAVDALISISNQLAELAGQNRISVDDARTTEFNALVEQYNAIVTGTSYVNNQELLETERDFDIQVAESQAEITIGEHLEGSAIITIPGSSGGGGVPTVGIGSFTLAHSTSAQVSTLFQPPLHETVIADFDSDGNNDLLISTDASNVMYLMLGNGDATLQTAITITTLGAEVRYLAVEDFDGDGNLDFVTGDPLGMQVYLGNGDGTFQAPTSFTAPGAADPFYAIVEDFDGDGNMDYALAGGAGFDVYLGNGDGTFAQSTSQSTPNGVDPIGESLDAADFDGDGNLDLVVAVNNYGPVVYFGNGDGTFGTPTSFAGYTFIGTRTVKAADIDGDGNQDFVVGNGDNNQMDVYLGNGNGTFQAVKTFAISTGAVASLELTDNNNDGALDIIYAQVPGVSLHYGNGDGTFQTESNSGGPNPSEFLTVADMNGDGFEDVVATGNGHGVYVYTADTTYVAPASATPDTTQTVNVARLITGLSIDTTSNANTAYEEISGRIIVLTREQRALQSNQTVLESAMGQVKGIRDVLKDSLDLLTSYDQADNLAQLSALQLKQLSGQAARNTHRLSFQTVSQLINSNTNIFSF